MSRFPHRQTTGTAVSTPMLVVIVLAFALAFAGLVMTVTGVPFAPITFGIAAVLGGISTLRLVRSGQQRDGDPEMLKETADEIPAEFDEVTEDGTVFRSASGKSVSVRTIIAGDQYHWDGL